MLPLIILGAVSLIGGIAIERRSSPVARNKRDRDRDATALARVIASEVGNHTLEEQLAVAFAVRNRAAKHKTSIHDMVCNPRCGPQGEKQLGNKKFRMRPFSSAQLGTKHTQEIAVRVLDATADPTKGATSFFEPAVQDKIVKGKRGNDPKFLIARFAGYKKTADEIRKQWLARKEKQLATVGRIELWA